MPKDNLLTSPSTREHLPSPTPPSSSPPHSKSDLLSTPLTDAQLATDLIPKTQLVNPNQPTKDQQTGQHQPEIVPAGADVAHHSQHKIKRKYKNMKEHEH